MPLRDEILELLKQQPQTASGLARQLGRYKADVRRLLFILERRGLVKSRQEKHGRVTWKYWNVITGSES